LPVKYFSKNSTAESESSTTSTVAVPDRGSGIRYLFDPWIRDPGWVKTKVRIRIREGILDEKKPGSYFLFWGKILKFLMRIRDPVWKNFRSGIRDP
jgi:hypothetical protein